MGENSKESRSVSKKSLSILLTVVLIYETVGVPLAQAYQEPQIWSERRLNFPSRHVLDQLPLTQTASMRLSAVDSRVPSGLSEPLKDVFSAVPVQNATIKEIDDSTDKEPPTPPVVLVQDIHLNPEAQSNIAAVIASLIDNKKAGVIGVEGAFAPFDFRPFHAFDDKAVVERVSRDFLESNVIGAPSYVGINRPGADVRFVGVDDENLYRANVAAYLTSRKTQGSVKATLAEIDQRLTEQKQKVFPPELLDVDRARHAYHSQKLGLGSYLKRMTAFGVEADFTVDTFMQAYAMESRLDFDRVEQERRWVVEKLVGRLRENQVDDLLTQSLAYQSGRLSYATFYLHLKKLCAENGIDLRSAPHFDDYIRYVLLCDGIKAEALLASVRRLEEAVFAKLASTPEQKQLVQESEHQMLAEKLVKFELTPEEWNAYKSVIPAGIQVSNLSQKNPYGLDSRFRWNDDLAPFESFYRYADARSEQIIKNLLAEKSGRSRVLVAGGYHTALLTDLLRKKKVPFVVVAPKMTKIPVDNGSAYLSVFAREKTPLEKLFAGEKLFMSPEIAAAGSSKAARPYVAALVAMIAVAIVAAGGVLAQRLGIVVQPDSSHAGLYKASMSLSFLDHPVTLFVALGVAVLSKVQRAPDVRVQGGGVWAQNPFGSWLKNTLASIFRFGKNPASSGDGSNNSGGSVTTSSQEPDRPSFTRDLIVTILFLAFLTYVAYLVAPYWGDLLSHLALEVADAGWTWAAAKASGAGTVAWLLYFTGNVVAVLTILTVATRFFIRSLARVQWGRTLIRFFQRGFKGYNEWTHHTASGNKLIEEILHLPIGLTKTMYGFGFERIDRLLQIIEGKNPNEMGWIEKGFSKIPRRWKILQYALLPVFATISLLGKRLLLRVYSGVGQFVLSGALSGALLAAAMALGYAPETHLSWLTAVMNWNILDIFMGAGWASSIHGGVGGAAVQLFSVFWIGNTLVLSVIMGTVGHAVRKLKAAKAEQPPMSLVKEIYWDVTRFPKYLLSALVDLFLFRKVIPVAGHDGQPIKQQTLWTSAIKSAFFSLEGLHLVGLEIEIFKWGSEFFEPFHAVVMKIEGHDEKEQSVLSAGDQFSHKLLNPFGLDPAQAPIWFTGGKTQQEVQGIWFQERAQREMEEAQREMEERIKRALEEQHPLAQQKQKEKEDVVKGAAKPAPQNNAEPPGSVKPQPKNLEELEKEFPPAPARPALADEVEAILRHGGVIPPDKDKPVEDIYKSIYESGLAKEERAKPPKEAVADVERMLEMARREREKLDQRIAEAKARTEKGKALAAVRERLNSGVHAAGVGEDGRIVKENGAEVQFKTRDDLLDFLSGNAERIQFVVSKDSIKALERAGVRLDPNGRLSNPVDRLKILELEQAGKIYNMRIFVNREGQQPYEILTGVKASLDNFLGAAEDKELRARRETLWKRMSDIKLPQNPAPVVIMDENKEASQTENGPDVPSIRNPLSTKPKKSPVDLRNVFERLQSPVNLSIKTKFNLNPRVSLDLTGIGKFGVAGIDLFRDYLRPLWYYLSPEEGGEPDDLVELRRQDRADIKLDIDKYKEFESGAAIVNPFGTDNWLRSGNDADVTDDNLSGKTAQTGSVSQNVSFVVDGRVWNLPVSADPDARNNPAPRFLTDRAYHTAVDPKTGQPFTLTPRQLRELKANAFNRLIYVDSLNGGRLVEGPQIPDGPFLDVYLLPELSEKDRAEIFRPGAMRADIRILQAGGLQIMSSRAALELEVLKSNASVERIKNMKAQKIEEHLDKDADLITIEANGTEFKGPEIHKNEYYADALRQKKVSVEFEIKPGQWETLSADEFLARHPQHRASEAMAQGRFRVWKLDAKGAREKEIYSFEQLLAKGNILVFAPNGQRITVEEARVSILDLNFYLAVDEKGNLMDVKNADPTKFFPQVKFIEDITDPLTGRALQRRLKEIKSDGKIGAALARRETERSFQQKTQEIALKMATQHTLFLLDKPLNETNPLSRIVGAAVRAEDANLALEQIPQELRSKVHEVAVQDLTYQLGTIKDGFGGRKAGVILAISRMDEQGRTFSIPLVPESQILSRDERFKGPVGVVEVADNGSVVKFYRPEEVDTPSDIHQIWDFENVGRVIADQIRRNDQLNVYTHEIGDIHIRVERIPPSKDDAGAKSGYLHNDAKVTYTNLKTGQQDTFVEYNSDNKGWTQMFQIIRRLEAFARITHVPDPKSKLDLLTLNQKGEILPGRWQSPSSYPDWLRASVRDGKLARMFNTESWSQQIQEKSPVSIFNPFDRSVGLVRIVKEGEQIRTHRFLLGSAESSRPFHDSRMALFKNDFRVHPPKSTAGPLAWGFIVDEDTLENMVIDQEFIDASKMEGRLSPPFPGLRTPFDFPEGMKTTLQKAGITTSPVWLYWRPKLAVMYMRDHYPMWQDRFKSAETAFPITSMGVSKEYWGKGIYKDYERYEYLTEDPLGFLPKRGLFAKTPPQLIVDQGGLPPRMSYDLPPDISMRAWRISKGELATFTGTYGQAAVDMRPGPTNGWTLELGHLNIQRSFLESLEDMRVQAADLLVMIHGGVRQSEISWKKSQHLDENNQPILYPDVKKRVAVVPVRQKLRALASAGIYPNLAGVYDFSESGAEGPHRAVFEFDGGLRMSRVRLEKAIINERSAEAKAGVRAKDVGGAVHVKMAEPKSSFVDGRSVARVMSTIMAGIRNAWSKTRHEIELSDGRKKEVRPMGPLEPFPGEGKTSPVPLADLIKVLGMAGGSHSKTELNLKPRVSFPIFEGPLVKENRIKSPNYYWSPEEGGDPVDLVEGKYDRMDILMQLSNYKQVLSGSFLVDFFKWKNPAAPDAPEVFHKEEAIERLENFFQSAQTSSTMESYPDESMANHLSDRTHIMLWARSQVLEESPDKIGTALAHVKDVKHSWPRVQVKVSGKEDRQQLWSVKRMNAVTGAALTNETDTRTILQEAISDLLLSPKDPALTKKVEEYRRTLTEPAVWLEVFQDPHYLEKAKDTAFAIKHHLQRADGGVASGPYENSSGRNRHLAIRGAPSSHDVALFPDQAAAYFVLKELAHQERKLLAGKAPQLYGWKEHMKSVEENEAATDRILQFIVKELWDPKEKIFRGGLQWTEDGQQRVVLPVSPSDQIQFINQIGISDLTSFILPGESEPRIKIDDITAYLKSIDSHFGVKDKKGKMVGYDFIPDRQAEPAISPARTVQAIIAKLSVSAYLQANHGKNPLHMKQSLVLEEEARSLVQQLLSLKTGKNGGYGEAYGLDGNMKGSVSTGDAEATRAGESLGSTALVYSLLRGLDPSTGKPVRIPWPKGFEGALAISEDTIKGLRAGIKILRGEIEQFKSDYKTKEDRKAALSQELQEARIKGPGDKDIPDNERDRLKEIREQLKKELAKADEDAKFEKYYDAMKNFGVAVFKIRGSDEKMHSYYVPLPEEDAKAGLAMWDSAEKSYLLYSGDQSSQLQSLLSRHRSNGYVQIQFGEKALEYLAESLLKTGTIVQLHPEVRPYRDRILKDELYGVASVYGERTKYVVDKETVLHVKPKQGVSGAFIYSAKGIEYQVTLTPKGREYVERVHRLGGERQALGDTDDSRSFQEKLNQMNRLLVDKEKELREGEIKLVEQKEAEQQKKPPPHSRRPPFSEMPLTGQFRKELSESDVVVTDLQGRAAKDIPIHLEEKLRDLAEEGQVDIEYEDAPGTWVRLSNDKFLVRGPTHRANSALAEGRYRVWMRDNSGKRGGEIFSVEQLLARGSLLAFDQEGKRLPSGSVPWQSGSVRYALVMDPMGRLPPLSSKLEDKFSNIRTWGEFQNLPDADRERMNVVLYEGEIGAGLLERQSERGIQNRNQEIATQIMGRHALFLAPDPFNPDLPLTQIAGDAMRERDIDEQLKKLPKNLRDSVRVVRTNTIRYEIGTVRDERGRERKGRVIRFSYVDSQNNRGSIDVVPRGRVVSIDETYQGKVGAVELGEDGGIVRLHRPKEVRPPDDAKALRDYTEAWENLLLQINENPRLPMYFYKGSPTGISVSIRAIPPPDPDDKKTMYYWDWKISLHSNRTGRNDVFIEPYGDPRDELEATLRTLRRYVAFARVTQEKDPRTSLGLLAVTQDGKILPSPWTTSTELPLDLQAAVAKGEINKDYKAEDWTTLARIQSPLSVLSAMDRVTGFVRFDVDTQGKPQLRRFIYGAEEATRPFRENRKEMFTSDVQRSHPETAGEDEPRVKLMNMRYGFPLEGGISRPLIPAPRRAAQTVPFRNPYINYEMPMTGHSVTFGGHTPGYWARKGMGLSSDVEFVIEGMERSLSNLNHLEARNRAAAGLPPTTGHHTSYFGIPPSWLGSPRGPLDSNGFQAMVAARDAHLANQLNIMNAQIDREVRQRDGLSAVDDPMAAAGLKSYFGGNFPLAVFSSLPKINNHPSAGESVFTTLSQLRLDGIPNFYAMGRQITQLQYQIAQTGVQTRVWQQSRIDSSGVSLEKQTTVPSLAASTQKRAPAFDSVATSRTPFELRSWERVRGMEIVKKELEEAADVEARLVKPFPGFHGEFALPESLSRTLTNFGLPADPILLYSNPALAYQYLHHSPEGRWPKAILDPYQAFPLSQCAVPKAEWEKMSPERKKFYFPMEESKPFLPRAGAYKSDPPILVTHPLGGPARIGYEPQPNEVMRAWLVMRGEMTFLRGTYGRNEVDATGGSPTFGWNIEWGLPATTRRLLQSMEDMNAEAVDFMTLVQGGFSGWNITIKPSGIKNKLGREINLPELKRLSSAGAADAQMTALKKMEVGVRADGFMDYQKIQGDQFSGRVVGYFDRGLRGLGEQQQIAQERSKEARKKAREAGAKEPVAEKPVEKKAGTPKNLLQWIEDRLRDYAAAPDVLKEPAQINTVETVTGREGRQRFQKIFRESLEGASDARFDPMSNLRSWRKGSDRYTWDEQTLRRQNSDGRLVESWERVYDIPDAADDRSRWQALLNFFPQRVELMEKGGYMLMDKATGELIEIQMGQNAFLKAKEGILHAKGYREQVEAVQFLSYRGPDPAKKRNGEFFIVMIPTPAEAEKGVRQNALDPQFLPDIPALKSLRDEVAKNFDSMPGTPAQVAEARRQAAERSKRVRDLYEIQQPGNGGGGVVLSPDGSFLRYEKGALALRDEFERLIPQIKKQVDILNELGYIKFTRKNGEIVIVMDDPEGRNRYGRTELEQLLAEKRLLDNRVGLLGLTRSQLRKGEITPFADQMGAVTYPKVTEFEDGLPKFDENGQFIQQTFPLLAKRDKEALPVNRRSIKTQVVDLSGFSPLQTSAAGLETRFNMAETKRFSFDSGAPMPIPESVRWQGKTILTFDKPVALPDDGGGKGVRFASHATKDALDGVMGQDVEYRLTRIPGTSLFIWRQVSKLDELGRTTYRYNEKGFLTEAIFEVKKGDGWKRVTASRPRLTKGGMPLADGNGDTLSDVTNEVTGESAVEHASALKEVVRRDKGFSTEINDNFVDHPVTEEWVPKSSLLFEGGRIRERQESFIRKNGDTAHDRFMIKISRAPREGPKFIEQFTSRDTWNVAGDLKARRQRVIARWTQLFNQDVLVPEYMETEDNFNTRASRDLFPELGLRGIEVPVESKNDAGIKLRTYSYALEKPASADDRPGLRITVRVPKELVEKRVEDEMADKTGVPEPVRQRIAADIRARYEPLVKTGYTHIWKLVPMTIDGKTDVRLRRVQMMDPYGGVTKFQYLIPNTYGVASRGWYEVGKEYTVTLMQSPDDEPLVNRETGKPLKTDARLKPDSLGLFHLRQLKRRPSGEYQEVPRFMNVFGQMEKELSQPDKAQTFHSDFIQNPLRLEWVSQTSLTIQGRRYDLYHHQFDPISWIPSSSQQDVDKFVPRADKKNQPVTVFGSLMNALIALHFVALAFGGAILIPIFWSTTLGWVVGFAFLLLFGTWPVIVLVLFASQAIRIGLSGRGPIAYVAAREIFADVVRLRDLPPLLQESIFQHEGAHLEGRGEFKAYIRQALQFPKALLSPQARALSWKKQTIVELVSKSQTKLGLDQLTEEGETGLVLGDLSERFTKWLDDRIVLGADRAVVERMRSRFAFDLHRLMTNQPKGPDLFAGSSGAFYADASAESTLHIVLHYLGGASLDVIRQQALALIKQTAASLMVGENWAEIRNVFVVSNQADRDALLADVVIGDAVRIGYVKILLNSEADKLSHVLRSLQSPMFAGRPFVSVADMRRAHFRFLVREGMDMSGFMDVEGIDLDRFRFFLLVTNTLNPVAVEVKSSQLDNLRQILNTIADQA